MAYEQQMLAATLMVTATEVAMATLLWMKADAFGKLGNRASVADEAAAPETRQEELDLTGSPTPSKPNRVSTALLSAVGLMILITSGGSAVREYLLARSFAAANMGISPRSSIYWVGYACEAAFGAAVFIGYTYGEQIRSFFAGDKLD